MHKIENVILSNGKCVTICIEGSKIAKIEDCTLSKLGVDSPVLALPGLIDPHVHSRDGQEEKEDWGHLARAALRGGVTTVLVMPNTVPPLITAQELARRAQLIGEQPITYRLIMGATNTNADEIKRVATNPNLRGKIAAVKVFRERSTGQLLVTNKAAFQRIGRICAENDLTMMVHVGDEQLIQKKRRQLGREPSIPDHCIIKDTEVELSGVDDALHIQKKTGCKLYLCHLSTPEAVERAHEAAIKGRCVYIEACPHHLWLSDERLSGEDGTFFKMNPPLRSHEQMQRLRQYVCDGLVDCIGSDHAPHTIQEKKAREYDNVPSGIPGIQTMFPLMYQAVATGDMDLQRFVRLTSQNAATIFGLESKGKIEVGYDADIVLVRPNEQVRFTHNTMETKCGWTPYNGMSATGAPKLTIARGAITSHHTLPSSDN